MTKPIWRLRLRQRPAHAAQAGSAATRPPAAALTDDEIAIVAERFAALREQGVTAPTRPARPLQTVISFPTDPDDDPFPNR